MLGCHKPVIPVVTFLTPLAPNERRGNKQKGSIGRAFTVRTFTEGRDRADFCPFALREVSVPAESALGHPRYALTDVPPQSNSPPGPVRGAAWEKRDPTRGQVSPPVAPESEATAKGARLPYHRVSRETTGVVVFHRRAETLPPILHLSCLSTSSD